MDQVSNPVRVPHAKGRPSHPRKFYLKIIVPGPTALKKTAKKSPLSKETETHSKSQKMNENNELISTYKNGCNAEHQDLAVFFSFVNKNIMIKYK